LRKYVEKLKINILTVFADFLLENLFFSAISFGGLAVSLFFYTGSTRVRIPVKPKLKKSLNFSQKLVVHAARARDRLIHDLALCQLRCAGLFISKWVGGFTGSGLFLIRVPHLNKNSRPGGGTILPTGLCPRVGKMTVFFVVLRIPSEGC
jgi:hypothetical protein